MRLIHPLLGLTMAFIVSPLVTAQSGDGLAAIDDVLDAYHGAAANGDWDTYFALMSEDSVFLGTDVSERWTREEFRAYASGRSGWVYRPVDRNVNLTPDGNSAWFDEVLDSASYGTARGTGVLIRTADGWKISQYHLTFPIPNDVVDDVIERIRALESGPAAQE